MTPEAELARRAKISAALKGRRMPPEQRAKIAASVKAARSGATAPSGVANAAPAPLPALPREGALEAHQRAVTARQQAVIEHELLDARVALLTDTLARMEYDLELARERFGNGRTGYQTSLMREWWGKVPPV